MKEGLFTFSKGGRDAMMASNRLVHFVGDLFQIEPMWDESIARKWDVLYIAAAHYGFCNALPHIAYAIRHSKRVVWIQNDYSVIPPKPVSRAESPFRKAFRERRSAGLPDMDFWSTIERYANFTPGSRYVNWNAFVWNPLSDSDISSIKRKKSALYYGSYRLGREKAFDKFFGEMTNVPWTVSSPSKKFAERYKHLNVIDRFEQSDFRKGLAGHSLGLYIEDRRSHVEFHSPANRFYEMLGAGLTMCFQKEAASMLRQAHFDVTPFIVDSEQDVLNALKKASSWRKLQRKMWYDTYLNDLIKHVRKVKRDWEKTL